VHKITEIRKFLFVSKCIRSFQYDTDNEICEVIQQENAGEDDVDQDDDDKSGVEGCPITHGAAADMLDKCLKWLEFQPEANLYNLTTLRELRSLAVKKRLDTMKQ